MTRDEYNRHVQEMQLMFPETRVSTFTSDGSNPAFPEGEIYRADFEVYWDGRWHTLGVERYPLTPKVEREWIDELEYRLRGEFADSLMHS